MSPAAALLALALLATGCAGGDGASSSAATPLPGPADGAPDGPRTADADIVAVDIDHHPGGGGYWILWDDGAVVAHGDARSFGPASAVPVAGRPVSLTPTASGDGYWVFTDAGEVVAHGDARAEGDVADLALAGEITGSVATPSGAGYLQVGADGGVFAHGDAPFLGSVPGTIPPGSTLTAPVVGIAPTATGDGYYLVGADGGVFAFGRAPFLGSIPEVALPGGSLDGPIVTLVPQPGGYLMLGSDGGIFNFGRSSFHGSLGGQGVTDVTAVSVTPDGDGYLVLRGDGTTHPFGSAETLPATGPGPTTTIPAGNDGRAARLRPEVLARHPHDTGAFTQGLEIVDGRLIESTGNYGDSDLRIVDVATGIPTSTVTVDASSFAEGVTEVDGTLIQLTWRENVAYRYGADDLAPIGTFAYAGEGWGICDAGDRLVMSDGSDTLTFRDRDDFSVLGTVTVTLDGAPVERLNELECVGDDVYANVWLTESIVRIDPATGDVEALIDAGALVAESGGGGRAVLNGIAHLDGDRFLVTGKNWPTLYEVRFVPG